MEVKLPYKRWVVTACIFVNYYHRRF